MLSGNRGLGGNYFYDLGNLGYFWSSTEYDATRADNRSLGTNFSNFGGGYSFKNIGLSIRCIKDETSTGIPKLHNQKNPIGHSLDQNYPNPFNPATIISYSIPKFSFVSIKIHDALGKEITTLVNEEKQPGNYEVKFYGSNLSSGVYYYQMKAGKFVETKKLILIK
jgi:hypothetical protein